MKNKEKLDDFMDINRDMFDVFDQPPDMWQKIENEMDTSPHISRVAKKKKLLSYSSRAAIVVAIFGASYVFHRMVDTPGVNDSTEVVSHDIASIYEATEFQETQTYYVIQVSNKLKELEQYASEYPEVILELKSEMMHLDNEFKKLQGDLNDGMAKQEIVDAMIQNYRLKLEILERMQDILKKNDKNKSDGKQDL